MAEIPKDIMETKILPKMPPEDLSRFKLVCKSFNSFISSPKFINGRLVILNTTGDGIHVFDLDSFNSPPFFLPFPLNFVRGSTWIPDYGISNLGSCNGLICFGNMVTKKLILLNPFTGMIFDIPPFLSLEKDLRFSMHNIGFGFDDSSIDYKIFAIVCGYQRRDVILFSLRANSWKLVSSSSHRDSLYGNGVLIENHLLHWVVTDEDMQTSGGTRMGRVVRLACFDLRTEAWADDVGLPDDSNTNWGCHKRCEMLGVFDGCLCLLTPTRLESQLIEVDMWVMKEYGMKDSWVKVLGGASDFSVTSTLRMCPLGSRYGSILDPDPDPQHEILLARGRKHTRVSVERVVLIWYNIKDKKCRLSQVHKLHGFAHHFYDAFTCTKSLVSLPGGSRIPKEKRTLPDANI